MENDIINNETNNPNRTNEIILKVGNIILSYLFMSLLLVLTMTILAPILSYSFLLIVGLFLIPIGLGSVYTSAESILKLLDNYYLFGKLLIIVCLILLIFNLVMGIIMAKNHKTSNYKSNIQVKKWKYIFLIYLFGYFGYPYFKRKDNIKGIIMIILSLSLFGLFVSAGLSLSEMVIAISKYKDQDGYIYL